MNFPTELLKQCWFLAGPTAVGKSSVALQLAQLLNAEILSMDSMAVYRGMDIGTAKPNQSEQSEIAHHLLDLVEPHVDFSMAEYCEAAFHAAQDVVARGRTPLFVGGTGLYLRAVLRGTFAGPSADWQLRQKWQDVADREGGGRLLQQLATVDPATARRLHANDIRRIIRALEVHALTGEALSSQQTQQPLPVEERPNAVMWLEPPRAWLRERIDRRVGLMMDQGLLEETRCLLSRQPPAGRTARQALGYRELIAHLENQMSREASVDLIRVRTRQFAKRQHTWFRNLEECQAVTIDGTEDSAVLAARIYSQFRRM